MSATVTYKGSTITTVNNQTRVLNTRGTWLEDNITIVDSTQSGTPAISVVDTADPNGGTVRTITALDISDTTAVASDVASGKYFYMANGTKTAGTNSGGGGSTPSATAHTIYFEFSDNTNATVTAYYDDSFISSAITATTPNTYGGKTVDSASLDGVAWYTRPTETWEVVFNGTVGFFPDDDPNAYPYCWISDLADVETPVGSTWRITFDGLSYVCVAKTVQIDTYHIYNMIGNPKYSGGEDDGSNVPLCLYHTDWGAWSGGSDVEPESGHAIVIERLVIA